jgi:soluble P-type ATPase
MIELDIPGRGLIKLEHLVTDVGGTLTLDGRLLDGLIRKLKLLQDRLQIHLVTANTYQTQDLVDHQLKIRSVRISRGEEALQKAAYINRLGSVNVVAIGQGANDAAMLKTAIIGIGLVSQEGITVETLQSADILVPDIHAALDLLFNPLRIVASLRI